MLKDNAHQQSELQMADPATDWHVYEAGVAGQCAPASAMCSVATAGRCLGRRGLQQVPVLVPSVPGLRHRGDAPPVGSAVACEENAIIHACDMTPAIVASEQPALRWDAQCTKGSCRAAERHGRTSAAPACLRRRIVARRLQSHI